MQIAEAYTKIQYLIVVDSKSFKLAGILLKSYVDIIHSGVWRADVAPLYYFIDIYLVTFKDCFYTAIRQVAHPASDSMSSRYLLCILPEINSLHLASDKYMSASLFLGILPHLESLYC